MARWRIRLRGVSPPVEGKHWEAENRLRVGRYEHLELVLNDPSISRRHAEVVVTDQGWVIRDLGSTNGTFLNGVRVGRTDRKVRQRDVIQFGNVVMVVQLLDEDVTTSNVETPSGSMQVQATTSNTWDKALHGAVFDDKLRPKVGDALLTLLRASHHLGHISSLDALLRSVLDDAVAALDSQRGAIVLWDEHKQELVLRSVSTGEKESTGRVYYSRNLAQRCFSREESVLCRDVNTNPELLIAHSIADGAMSSIICTLLRSPRKKLGVLHLDRGPLQGPFTAEDLHLADALAASVSAGIECAQLYERQREMFLQTVTALAQAVELRDSYTGGHTQRVTDYSLIMADALMLSAEDRHTIQVGTPLHDIGKIGIDDSILRKPGKLTAEEFEIMKTHTTKGAQIIETIPELKAIIPIVKYHHEAWDGSGYPEGLAGDKIPYIARIVTVADAFDAMTSNRPYRKGMAIANAFREIEERAGKQFDPVVAETFIKQRSKIEEALVENLSQEEDIMASDGEGAADQFDPAGPPTCAMKKPSAG